MRCFLTCLRGRRERQDEYRPSIMNIFWRVSGPVDPTVCQATFSLMVIKSKAKMEVDDGEMKRLRRRRSSGLGCDMLEIRSKRPGVNGADGVWLDPRGRITTGCFCTQGTGSNKPTSMNRAEQLCGERIHGFRARLSRAYNV